MREVDFNVDCLLEAGCEIKAAGVDVIITMPNHGAVRVRRDGEKLILFPERSSQAQALMAILDE